MKFKFKDGYTIEVLDNDNKSFNEIKKEVIKTYLDLKPSTVKSKIHDSNIVDLLLDPKFVNKFNIFVAGKNNNIIELYSKVNNGEKETKKISQDILARHTLDEIKDFLYGYIFYSNIDITSVATQNVLNGIKQATSTQKLIEFISNYRMSAYSNNLSKK